MNRRAVLLAAGAALGAGGLAGCLESPSNDALESTPTAESTGSPTPTEGPLSHHEASNAPDPDLPIVAENRHDVAHALSVAVARDGETLHEATYELAPGDDRELYNLRETDPDGIESFTVTATLDGRTESVDVRTNACHGHVVAWISEDGDLGMTYSIC